MVQDWLKFSRQDIVAAEMIYNEITSKIPFDFSLTEKN